jgi:hypothetical protein
MKISAITNYSTIIVTNRKNVVFLCVLKIFVVETKEIFRCVYYYLYGLNRNFYD